MKTVTEHIRDAHYKRLGLNLADRKTDNIMLLMRGIERNQNQLDNIVKLAKDRLFMGAIRYGVEDNAKKYDYGKEIIKRVNRYYKTGNTENLIDALNFCALEFHAPRVAGAFFKVQDDAQHTKEIG